MITVESHQTNKHLVLKLIYFNSGQLQISEQSVIKQRAVTPLTAQCEIYVCSFVAKFNDWLLYAKKNGLWMFRKWFFYVQQKIFIFSKWLSYVQLMIFIFSKRLLHSRRNLYIQQFEILFSNMRLIFNKLRFAFNEMKFIKLKSFTFNRPHLDVTKAFWRAKDLVFKLYIQSQVFSGTFQMFFAH